MHHATPCILAVCCHAASFQTAYGTAAKNKYQSAQSGVMVLLAMSTSSNMSLLVSNGSQQYKVLHMCHCHGHHSDAHCSKAFLLRSNLTDTLFILFLYNNDFEGDLSVVSGANLGVVSTADNPKLCGMVPASVRWAHGYNPHNTSLGMPCA